MTREDFEDKYEKGNINIVEKIANLDNDPNNFNVFKILGLTDYEIRHSNFLAWLFNNKTFFKMFIQTYNDNINADIKKNPNIYKIDEKSIVLEKMEIKREEHFIQKNGDNDVYIITDKETKETIYKEKKSKEKKSEGVDYYTLNKGENGEFEKKLIFDKKRISRLDSKKGKPIGRYIDLNIIGDDFTITIENKIDSDEHDFQCIAYRNYVENTYSGKEHYYVYLAKEKPSDFNSDIESGIYPGYVCIKYKQIRDILNRIKTKNFDEYQNKIFEDYQIKIVDNYISIINEWENLPKSYKEELEKYKKDLEKDKKYLELEDFTNNNNYYNLIKNEGLSSQQKRFAEVARQYALEKKKRIDDIIKSTINELLRSGNKNFIKGSYGRGSYASAVPLWFDLLGDEEKQEYFKVNNKEPESYLKNDKIKNNTVLQTIDYRAPMDGLEYPSVGIFAGLKKEYSDRLCEKIIKSNTFLDQLKKLNPDEWNLELRLYLKNGSNYIARTDNGKDIKVECILNNIPKDYKKREEIFTNAYLKKGNATNIFSNTYWDYLKTIKENKIISDDKLCDWTKYITDYFLKDNGIKKTKEVLKDFCFYDKFKKQYKKDDSSFDIKKINDFIILGPRLNADAEKNIKILKELDSFFDWLQTTNDIEELKKLEECKDVNSLNRLEKTDIIQEIIQIIGASNFEPNDNARKVLLKCLDKRTHKQMSTVWSLSLISPVKEVEMNDILLKEYSNEEDYKKDINTIKEQLIKPFYKKTLEGLKVFGEIYEKDNSQVLTYYDFFKQTIFGDFKE